MKLKQLTLQQIYENHSILNVHEMRKMEITQDKNYDGNRKYRLFMGVNVKCLRVGQLIRAVWRAFVILQTL